jgi:hypothetical protein
LTELKDPVDVIDFSDPPLTVSGTATWTRITNRGVVWPVNILATVAMTSFLGIDNNRNAKLFDASRALGIQE